MNVKKYWWKGLSILLLFYVIVAGLLLDVPRLPILNETIRNLYFHVPMWFGMVLMLGGAAWHSIRHLRTSSVRSDVYAVELTNTAVLFGVLGLLTGMVWAKFTWGAFWVGDPKLNTSAVGMMLYLAYLVLRSALPDPQQRGRISAIYNIFAFATFIPLIFVLPRLTDSLHPGNGGNPGFNAYDLDNKLRLVFYPAVIGWFLLGLWITNLRIRLQMIQLRAEEKMLDR